MHKDYIEIMNQQGFNLSGVSKINYGILRKLQRKLTSYGINPRSYLLVMIPTIANWLEAQGKNTFVPPAMLVKESMIRWYQNRQDQSDQTADTLQQRLTPISDEDRIKAYYAHCEDIYARRYIAMRVREGLAPEESHTIGMMHNQLEMRDITIVWKETRGLISKGILVAVCDEIVHQLEKEYYRPFDVNPFAKYPYESIVETILNG